MKVNTTSLCNTCVYAASCNLTSNKNAIWSCSEFETERLKNTNQKTNLLPNLNFTKSEKEIEFI
ncbi:hypothetical protein [Tenacibaculum aquimarinum]|uniref:hypothetical protein n=1 Tax=Tenacibaculum aquimarinum TaxID=2910675 RepID=UPI001F0A9C19|nr:hypothetical protein [Tenacibaculum aquimarinum]MCH3885020.1 hypothetical protein [Tenacibaculum aquimarinum]